MNQNINFFATCPKNLESLLLQELKQLGAINTKETVAGVTFQGPLEVGYRACLWSRLANRILLPLKEIRGHDADTLYSGVRSINWLDEMSSTDSFVIDFAGTSDKLKNTHFSALKVKDAIVDQMREKTGARPEIDKENPKIRINAYLRHDRVTISLDLSGDSLHRRGYRSKSSIAPLKENLAAAILYRANWPEIAKQNKPLLDPMCGSGTILLEAAMMAADVAPGLLHKKFGFTHWRRHQKNIWEKLFAEAKERRRVGIENAAFEVRGYDADPAAIGAAKFNIEQAGLSDCIAVVVKELNKFTPPTHHGNQMGIVVTNPPYGERLGRSEELPDLYRNFGSILRERFGGWDVGILTGNPDLAKTMGIRAHQQYNFFNGAIPCKFLLFKINIR